MTERYLPPRTNKDDYIVPSGITNNNYYATNAVKAYARHQYVAVEIKDYTGSEEIRLDFDLNFTVRRDSTTGYGFSYGVGRTDRVANPKDPKAAIWMDNPAFIENNGVNRGQASAYFGIGGSDRLAEIDMVKRDLELAESTGADISIQHISTKEAVELVREAKKTNSHIHAEATPHHFTLTEDAVMAYGTLAKMNPPLREEEDRLAIIKGLQDGTIDMIATDHAPHSAEEKAKPITEAPSGIVGLETALSLGIRELVDKGYLSMMELIRKMSLAPARLYHLEAGYLKEGGPADLVVFDPKREWVVQDFASKSANSPFVGETMPGVVSHTICGGKIVYREGTVR